jgi:hypothetical protein
MFHQKQFVEQSFAMALASGQRDLLFVRARTSLQTDSHSSEVLKDEPISVLDLSTGERKLWRVYL